MNRAMGLASRAFVSVLPLLIVFVALVPADPHTLQTTLARRMGMDSSATAAIKQLIAPKGEIRDQLTLVAGLLVLISALSFMRTLQQLYEHIWRLPRLGGVRSTPWGLGGLMSLILYFILIIVTGAIIRHLPGSTVWSALVALAAGAALWLLVPYLLLARRIAIRRLVPGAMFTALAMVLLSAGMSIYLPRSISSHAARFGPIGVVFALLYWFVAVAFVVVGAGVAGAVYGENETAAGESKAVALPEDGPVRPQSQPSSVH